MYIVIYIIKGRDNNKKFKIKKNIPQTNFETVKSRTQSLIHLISFSLFRHNRYL